MNQFLGQKLKCCCCFYSRNDVLQVAQRNVSIVPHTQHRVRSLSCCQSFSLSVSPAQPVFCVNVLVEELSCQAGSTGSVARPGTNHAKTQATTGQPSAAVLHMNPASAKENTRVFPGGTWDPMGVPFNCNILHASLPRPIMWVPGGGPLFYPYPKVGLDAVTGRDPGAWWVSLDFYLHLVAYIQLFI